MKLQMHSNELEHICEALNLIAEGIHTSRFSQGGGLLYTKQAT